MFFCFFKATPDIRFYLIFRNVWAPNLIYSWSNPCGSSWCFHIAPRVFCPSQQFDPPFNSSSACLLMSWAWAEPSRVNLSLRDNWVELEPNWANPSSRELEMACWHHYNFITILVWVAKFHKSLTLLCSGHTLSLSCRIWCRIAWNIWKWYGAVFH